MKLTAKNGWTGGQFSLFRFLLGTYLFVHFIQLLPWVAEVFSSQGMLANAANSPLINLFPNILNVIDTPLFVQVFVGIAALSALFFAIGFKEKFAALLMWYVLACLFTRNPLIANPSLPYAGWMLLAFLFIPSAPFGSLMARGRENPAGDWFMPQPIFIAAWVVLAISYSYSGYTKLLSPSWVDGNNIRYVLQNPLARDYFLRDFFLWLPPLFLQILTWSVLYIELLFAPLVLFSKMRFIMWGAMLFIQCGFAFLLNFPDLTAAMILFHLFTFNPEWIKSKPLEENATLFYDGYCALCHGVIRFMLAEDRNTQLRFSPLQSDVFESTLTLKQRENLPDTIVLINGKKILLKSDAVIELLAYLGGIWRLFAIVLKLFPRFIRDAGYDVVGKIRHIIFGKTEAACPLVPAHVSKRFVHKN